MASPVIQFKRGAYANLPGLQAGEPALTTDTYELYVGINSTTNGNKFFGSHRYWTREGTTTGSAVNLVEGSSNGSSYVSLKAPDSLASTLTLTLPSADGSNGNVLVTDGSGNLSFAAPAASSFTLAADSGSNDTFNTGETLTFTGGTGISATVSNNQISYGLDAELEALSSVTSAANKLPYFTGSGTATVTDLSAFGRSLIDDADASAARTTLGVDAAGTDNSTDVTLTGSYDYLTISGQAITLGQIDLTTDVSGTLPLANGGIGATTAAGARSNLGVVIGTDVQAYDAELAALASVTSAANKLPYFTGSGTATVTDLSSFGRTLIDDADASAARTTLGVDAAGTDNSTDVTLAGSYDYLTISGQAITLGQVDLTTDVSGTLPLANGGIGATTAAGARTNLGLAIGSDVQAHGDILDDLSGLTQAANKLPYFDSSTTAATTTLSSFGRTLIDDADAAAARSTLNVDAAGTDNSTDVTLAGSYDYLTISGQAITLGQIDLTSDVTGALPNANLANSTITVSDGSNSTATALGGTITFSGTANEVTVAESSGTVTIGLPDSVSVTSDLTVGGNLTVLGSQSIINTETLRVEDSLIEVGMVNSGGNLVAPTSDANIDVGLVFHYYSGSAKKAAVYWDDSAARIAVASDVSESSSVMTASAYAALEVGGLWVNDCAGQSQVISCSGSTRSLENITIDGGTF